MLVMYTLNNTVTSKLPPTSYIKLIDVWLLFGLLLPFLIIILLIIIEHLPKPKVTIMKVSSAKNDHDVPQLPLSYVSKFARIYLPILEVGFVVGYAIVAFLLY